MPELPDLEQIKEVLNRRLGGKEVEKVEIPRPLVLRCLQEQLLSGIEGNLLQSVKRRGKFILFSFETGTLVFHPMLSGRFQLAQKGKRLKCRTCLRLGFVGGQELRYFDPRFMGRIYWVQDDDFSGIPQYPALGPDALDQSLSLELFKANLRHFRGMIKNVLTNQRFLAGIGNAYADEILFTARISPLRKRSTLSLEEIKSLYQAIGSVLTEAIEILKEKVGEKIEVEERGFFRVHRGGGGPCPVCGTILTEVSPNRQITTFCRHCQR